MKNIGIKGYVFKNSAIHCLSEAIGKALEGVFYADSNVTRSLYEEIKVLADSNGLNAEMDKILHLVENMKDENGFIPNERELFVLSSRVAGIPVKKIADLLKTTARTITMMQTRMRTRCAVATNHELISIAYRNRWVK